MRRSIDDCPVSFADNVCGFFEVYYYDVLFDVRRHCLCGRGDIVAWTEKFYKLPDPGLSGGNSGSAFSILNRSNSLVASVVVLLDGWGSLENEATLMHECFHSTCHVMRARGIPLTESSEEVYAYYQDDLFKTYATKLDNHYGIKRKSKRTKR